MEADEEEGQVKDEEDVDEDSVVTRAVLRALAATLRIPDEKFFANERTNVSSIGHVDASFLSSLPRHLKFLV